MKARMKRIEIYLSPDSPADAQLIALWEQFSKEGRGRAQAAFRQALFSLVDDPRRPLAGSHGRTGGRRGPSPSWQPTAQEIERADLPNALFNEDTIPPRPPAQSANTVPVTDRTVPASEEPSRPPPHRSVAIDSVPDVAPSAPPRKTPAMQPVQQRSQPTPPAADDDAPIRPVSAQPEKTSLPKATEPKSGDQQNFAGRKTSRYANLMG